MFHLLLTLTFTVSSFAAFAQTKTQTANSQSPFSYYVEADLLPIQQKNASRMSVSEMQKLNEKTLNELENYEPSKILVSQKGERLNSLSYAWANTVMKSIDQHPVVSSYQYSKYNNKGVEIGFCFGRATYVHIALLRMGVNKEAIKKIWAVGPMDNGLNWAFHVATAVKGDQANQWWVIDNFPGKVLEARAWFNYMKPMSTDQKLQVFITEPEKFSVSLGKYDRVQLGLDLSRQDDWYSSYFKDLMAWFAQGIEVLEQIGLRDLRTGSPRN